MPRLSTARVHYSITEHIRNLWPSGASMLIRTNALLEGLWKSYMYNFYTIHLGSSKTILTGCSFSTHHVNCLSKHKRPTLSPAARSGMR